MTRSRTRPGKPIRDRLRIGTGDLVDFTINDRGEIVVRAATSDVKELRGLLRADRARKPAVAIERMNAAVLKEHARKR